MTVKHVRRVKSHWAKHAKVKEPSMPGCGIEITSGSAAKKSGKDASALFGNVTTRETIFSCGTPSLCTQERLFLPRAQQGKLKQPFCIMKWIHKERPSST